MIFYTWCSTWLYYYQYTKYISHILSMSYVCRIHLRCFFDKFRKYWNITSTLFGQISEWDFFVFFQIYWLYDLRKRLVTVYCMCFLCPNCFIFYTHIHMVSLIRNEVGIKLPTRGTYNKPNILRFLNLIIHKCKFII